MLKGSWFEFDSSIATLDDEKSLSNSSKSENLVDVQTVKAGKRGKTVTVISGLGLNSSQARQLLKKLKASCGTGGTVKSDSLELQGDQRQKVQDFLIQEGFKVKKSGG